MGKKSQFFRAFVEGSTMDGRTVSRDMVDQVVETFSTDNYTPRINIEHIAGYSPEPPFNGYGSVIAVRAQDDVFVIDGKEETRRALYVQVEGNDQLVRLVAADQKPFPSVELTPSYAGTDKFGLVGLAFTDTPASIGTQALKFIRTAPGTLFATADEPVALRFEADREEPAGIAATVASVVAATFARLGFKSPEPDRAKETPVTPPAPANDNAALFSAVALAVSDGVAAAVAPINAEVAALATRLDALADALATTEQPGFARQPATGGAGAVQADF
ncbi:GPO family capsid scaffolding protein [Sphingomonas morindae]|uniref:GPO family capsid scaffolding protein n=1 Tax=Sphingomonas morindae TaxID=1541170 RepID=A0ABY4X7V4_9SPHN|nr:GPO family capsid scaffolding protein [Sphingomonas morindae]USI72725.1 GPO family capsid scaffolding protein [Sphingomonas morindae]